MKIPNHAFFRAGAVLLLSLQSLGAESVILDVPERIQEQTEWCWAGVTQSLLAYHGTKVRQCEIANFTRLHASWHDFGSDDCCSNPSGACNYWNYNYGAGGSMEEILANWGVGGRGMGRALSLEEARSELEEKRPFIIRWALNTGGGHFVVGHGLSDSILYYMDPWPGEGAKLATFSWVASNNRDTWTHTNTLSFVAVRSLGKAASRSVEVFAHATRSGLSVSYRAPRGQTVHLEVRTLHGGVVESIDLPASGDEGPHRIQTGWSLPPGVYLLDLRAGTRRASALVVPAR